MAALTRPAALFVPYREFVKGSVYMIREAFAEHAAALLPRDSFHPFPRWGGEKWRSLPPLLTDPIVKRAEEINGQPIPVLPATVYMQFVKIGDRANYEKVYFERRINLRCLALAELICQDGRFIDQIINLIWAICEETTWCIPAHAEKSGDLDDALVDVERDRVVLDLFTAETGSALAWVSELLGDRLDAVCRQVKLRVTYELKRRVLAPYEEYDDFWWMGLVPDHRGVNNWNPWINSNVLAVLLLTEEDDTRRRRLAEKICLSADKFLATYAPDGGCDEGPSYFSVAGASLIDLLEELYIATSGQVDLFREETIVNMADYIRHVHIADGYFVNFADAPAKLSSCDEPALLRLARRTGNEKLAAFCRMRIARQRPPQVVSSITDSYSCTFRSLMALLDADVYTDADAPDSASPGHWFPGIQVAVARQAENSFSGLFLAAKGGTNGESHNHNDIGNYVIYVDGRCAVIDAGVGIYSRKTFSPQRY